MDDADTEGRPDARRRRRLAILLASPLVGLVVLELAARARLGPEFVPGERRGRTWTVCARRDPELGWANLEGVRARIRRDVVDYHVAIDEHGRRDRERDGSARQRVDLLGGSLAWGWGVDDGKRFSDILDRRLGPEVDVVNLAVPGYGTDQELLMLERHLGCCPPDVVLLCYALNDAVEVEYPLRYDMDKPVFERADDGAWRLVPPPARGPAWAANWVHGWQWAEAHSGLVALLVDWSLQLPWNRPATRAIRPTYAPPTEKRLALTVEAAERLADPDSAVRMLLGRLRARCADLGVELIVFPLPEGHDQYLYEPNFPRPDHPAGEPFQSLLGRRLAEAGRDLGFTTVAIEAVLFDAVAEGQRLHCGDGHLNARAHALVATAIEPELRRALAARDVLR